MKLIKRFFKYTIAFFIIVLVGVFVFQFVSNLYSERKIEMDSFAQPVEAIKIPQEVSIVGLGEGTHGTSEFQKLRLKIVQKLVEEENFRSIGLEAGYGEVSKINQYILGHSNHYEFQYPLNQTEEMAALIEWLKKWNSESDDEDKVRIYGYDMQGSSQSAANILEKLSNDRLDKATKDHLEIIKETKKVLDKQKAEEINKNMVGMMDRIKKLDDSWENYDLYMEFNEVSQAMQTWLLDQDYNSIRDQFMFENIEKILHQEQNFGNEKLIIFGHNVHLSKYHTDYSVLGNRLSKQYDKSYYCIGTGFFKGKVNVKLLGIDRRVNIYLNSGDTLAAQAKFVDDQSYWLDLSLVKDTSNDVVMKLVRGENNRINIGEGYSSLMKLDPNSYRTKDPILSSFDSMIYYYETHPIQLVR